MAKSKASPLSAHHQAWIDCHPHRSERWLRARLSDGFDVHHMDGNPQNNDPDNLVLIEHDDHMRIHGNQNISVFRFLPMSDCKGKGLPSRLAQLPDGRYIATLPRERKAVAVKRFLESPGAENWRLVSGKASRWNKYGGPPPPPRWALAQKQSAE